MEQHAVIAHFDYEADSLDVLFSIEEQLEAAINAGGGGGYGLRGNA